MRAPDNGDPSLHNLFDGSSPSDFALIARISPRRKREEKERVNVHPAAALSRRFWFRTHTAVTSRSSCGARRERGEREGENHFKSGGRWCGCTSEISRPRSKIFHTSQRVRAPRTEGIEKGEKKKKKNSSTASGYRAAMERTDHDDLFALDSCSFGRPLLGVRP